jgi:hypothetical protein
MDPKLFEDPNFKADDPRSYAVPPSVVALSLYSIPHSEIVRGLQLPSLPPTALISQASSRAQNAIPASQSSNNSLPELTDELRELLDSVSMIESWY